MKSKVLQKIFLIALIFGLGAGSNYLYLNKLKPSSQISQTIEKDDYLAFLSEVYDLIQENYWDKISDEKLTELFQLGVEKITGQPQMSKAKDKSSLFKSLAKTVNKQEDKTKKKELVAQLADVVLANLQPFGRNRLYTKKEETALDNTVKNINPEVDQYEILEVEKQASSEKIEMAYQEKRTELEPKKDTSPEAKQEYEQVEQAYKALSDEDNRKLYDTSGVEPTMDYQLISPEIFYLHIKKFSPTTFDELKRVTEKVDDQEGLDTLILDLRDNVGGAIDGLPYFLGPFIGPDQYAYEFFHQEEKTPFKTKTGWLPSLVRYKKMVILINENTQSSAEAMAAVLKKYNVGIVVGTPSKGWGTVERVFPLDKQLDPSETYSVFLVHSLVLRDDGQPIEGKGVEPLINITDSDWESQLYSYFHYQDLVGAVKEVLEL
ncbi:DnaJ domain-containing protein [Candidatus Microgenomates bacterium]|nr:DnaJ domain-containing protein [Candidatus Microgenomates bacterium]